MMLKCINPFGNFRPGQEVLVPDDSIYDSAYFELAPDVEEKELAPEAGEAIKEVE